VANDIITHLDDAPLQDLSLYQAVEKVRGPVDTAVRLRILRKGQDQPIEVSIVRALIRPTGAAADLEVAIKDSKLQIEASGALPILDFDKGAPVAVTAASENEFFVDGGDHTRLRARRGRPAGAFGAKPGALADHRSADQLTADKGGTVAQRRAKIRFS